MLAELKANRLAKHIYLHRELWQYSSVRLAELTEIPEAKDIISRQRIFDSAGKLVLETGEAPAWPVVSRSVPVMVAASQDATVETATTLRHVLILTAVVATASSMLGLAIFFVIRILPLRIVDRTLAQLGATQARLLATIDAIPIEFMEYDRQRRLVLINSAARVSQGWNAESIGMTERELLERSLVERRAADPDRDWDGWMADRLATLERVGSVELTRPSGESGRFFVKDMPGGGRVVLRIDITESKQREAELASTQARYRLLFEANPLPMAVVVVDTDRFIDVNDAAVPQYGWSREEFLAMTADELYLPEDMPALMAERRREDIPGVIRTVRGLRHPQEGRLNHRGRDDRASVQPRWGSCHAGDEPGCHRARACREGAAVGGGATAAVTEDGSDRAVDRRRRARFQQHPHRDHGQRRCTAGSTSRSRDVGGARR